MSDRAWATLVGEVDGIRQNTTYAGGRWLESWFTSDPTPFTSIAPGLAAASPDDYSNGLFYGNVEGTAINLYLIVDGAAGLATGLTQFFGAIKGGSGLIAQMPVQVALVGGGTVEFLVPVFQGGLLPLAAAAAGTILLPASLSFGLGNLFFSTGTPGADPDSVIRLHHPWPKYLGGPSEQALEALPKSVHDAYHSGLDKILPRQWGTKYYEGLSDAARLQMQQDLAAYTKAFDAKYGTSLFQSMLDNGFPGH